LKHIACRRRKAVKEKKKNLAPWEGGVSTEGGVSSERVSVALEEQEIKNEEGRSHGITAGKGPPE